MLGRFDSLFAAFKRNEPLQGVLNTLPADMREHLVYCFKKLPGSSSGVFSAHVNGYGAREGCTQPNASLELMEQRVWFTETRHGYDAYVDTLPDYRDDFYVDMDKPVFVFTTNQVPTIRGFS